MNATFNEIHDAEELKNLFQKSFEEPVLLFKHSLTCPISANAYNEMTQAEAEINIIIVQHARDVSNALAEKTGIRHESPQAIILKDGEPVYHASHYKITADEVERQLEVGG
jgi:bacillithiol system protein YtxJ